MTSWHYDVIIQIGDSYDQVIYFWKKALVDHIGIYADTKNKDFMKIAKIAGFHEDHLGYNVWVLSLGTIQMSLL